MSKNQEQNRFYNTSEWRRLRSYILEKNHYLCEQCDKPAKIVHHIEWITERNLNDPTVTLNEDNLMAVCQDCHNRIHTAKGIVQEGLMFDEAGELVEINMVSK